MKFVLPAILIFGVISFTRCQSTVPSVVTNPIAWFAHQSNIKLSNRTSISFDGQYRFLSDFEPAQFMVRIGGDYKLSDRFSVMPLGYTYVWNSPYGKQPAAYSTHEQRIFQQFQFLHASSNIRFAHRLRTEERFIEEYVPDQDGTIVLNGFTNFQFRVRYRFQMTIPFKKGSLTAGSWSAVISDEVFMSWGQKVSYHSPDQNRVFAAISYHFTDNFSLAGGPFYQVLIKAGGAQQENNVGTLFVVTYNVDLRKSDP